MQGCSPDTGVHFYDKIMLNHSHVIESWCDSNHPTVMSSSSPLPDPFETSPRASPVNIITIEGINHPSLFLPIPAVCNLLDWFLIELSDPHLGFILVDRPVDCAIKQVYPT